MESAYYMSNIGSAHIVLFFTYGMSLLTWDRLGMFDREVALYRELQPKLGGISFVTYGGNTDMEYSRRLPGIEILCNRFGLPLKLYAGLIPYLHARPLRQADVFKTNQTNGAEVALHAARLHDKRLIARCGYMWSDFVAKGAEKEYSLEKVKRIEKNTFSHANKVIVTTQIMKENVEKDYGIPSDKVHVIPNYVDTNLFIPKQGLRQERTICFVGRLDDQKNPLGLLEAIAGIDVRLTMVGTGPMKAKAEEVAKRLALNVDFIEHASHRELPEMLNKASLFVLPSFYEGHPKTLIEAMSCGLPVIGADSPGIREIIKHGKTGYLCGTDTDSISSAIKTLLADRTLCERLGRNACEYAVNNFALDKIVNRELDLLNEVATQ
jgi:glycosyltransferase involved in cell wall biosynthesis